MALHHAISLEAARGTRRAIRLVETIPHPTNMNASNEPAYVSSADDDDDMNETSDVSDDGVASTSGDDSSTIAER